MHERNQTHMSRRLLIQSGVVLGVGSAMFARPAASAAGLRVHRASKPGALLAPRPRVVACQGLPARSGEAFNPCEKIDWIASQVGSVDLIAFHTRAQSISPDALSMVCGRAARHNSYVALGVLEAGDDVPASVLVSPDGDVVAYGAGDTDAIGATSIGLVVMSAKATPRLDVRPEIFIHSGPGDEKTIESGAYTIYISATSSGGPGSAIYAPDGIPLTRTESGWTQGIVATLDIGRLRRDKAETLPV